MKKYTASMAFLVCVVSFSLCGCLNEEVFNAPYVPPKPRSLAKRKAKSPSLEPSEEMFSFEQGNKRDPFVPRDHRLVKKVKDSDATKGPLVRPTPRRAQTPLQRYEIDALRLKAVISGTSSPMAVIVDPEGSSHIVRRGDAIGPHGRVARILARGLVISSTRRTGQLTRRRTYRMMRFQKGTKGKRQRGFIQSGGQRLKFGTDGQIQRK